MEFECLKCGRCCHEIPNLDEENAYKRIPIYPEEADRLEKLADNKNVTLRLIEDLVFPDVKNQKILVLTWRILLDNSEKVCPFYDQNVGCTIHDQKPLTCQSYPLAIQAQDAFNQKIEIGPLCEFTIQNRAKLENIEYSEFLDIYKNEYNLAKKLLSRNKTAIMNIIGRERLGEIEIPRSLDPKDYDFYLKNWERIVIYDEE